MKKAQENIELAQAGSPSDTEAIKKAFTDADKAAQDAHGAVTEWDTLGSFKSKNYIPPIKKRKIKTEPKAKGKAKGPPPTPSPTSSRVPSPP